MQNATHKTAGYRFTHAERLKLYPTIHALIGQHFANSSICEELTESGVTFPNGRPLQPGWIGCLKRSKHFQAWQQRREKQTQKPHDPFLSSKDVQPPKHPPQTFTYTERTEGTVSKGTLRLICETEETADTRLAMIRALL